MYKKCSSSRNDRTLIALDSLHEHQQQLFSIRIEFRRNWQHWPKERKMKACLREETHNEKPHYDPWLEIMSDLNLNFEDWEPTVNLYQIAG